MRYSPSLLKSSPKNESVALYARYRSDAAVAQYCDLHYGPDKFGVPNFPQKMAQLSAAELAGKPQRKALDLGCAVGRSSFELATCFDQVTGVDFSARFIDIAQRLKQRGKLCYQLSEEGDLISDQQVFLADLGLAEAATRVSFLQGNAQCLEPHFCHYDLILAANLIDRLSTPGKFLANIHRRLVIDGLLVIASPYDWLERFTTPKQWLGGRFRAGLPVASLDGLKKKLAKHFVMLGEPRDVEFVVRETARTFRHSISQVTLWRRVR